LCADATCPFEELKFDLDQVVLDGIEQGINITRQFRKDITIICPVYDGVGKSELKQKKVLKAGDEFWQFLSFFAY